MPPHFQSFDCLLCDQKCRSSGGLLKHEESKHPNVTLPDEATAIPIFVTLTLMVCTYPLFSSHPQHKFQGDHLLLMDHFCHTNSQTYPQRPNGCCVRKPWAPFEDLVAFDFAQYHYVEFQSSEGEIAKGLDLLCATVIKHDGLPWKSAKELHATIDSIQTGSAPWKTYKFRYTGPKPVYNFGLQELSRIGAQSTYLMFST